MFCETQEWLVVSIRQPRRLRAGELKAIGVPANGVEKAIQFLVGEPERGGIAFQNFFILKKQVITEHDSPFPSSKPLENLERSPAPRKQCSEDHVCIENGAYHNVGRLDPTVGFSRY